MVCSLNVQTISGIPHERHRASGDGKPMAMGESVAHDARPLTVGRINRTDAGSVSERLWQVDGLTPAIPAVYLST